jgi:hypothetical protein
MARIWEEMIMLSFGTIRTIRLLTPSSSSTSTRQPFAENLEHRIGRKRIGSDLDDQGGERQEKKGQPGVGMNRREKVNDDIRHGHIGMFRL